MAKQIILLILLSIIVVIFQNQISEIMNGLVSLHDLFAKDLTFFFSGSAIGRAIQGVIALLLIPVVAGGLSALAFWLVKHVSMPHMMATIWIMWLVVLVAVLSHGAGAGAGGAATQLSSASTAMPYGSVAY